MYREEVFEDMKSNGRDLKTFYIWSPSGTGKSKFTKDLARKINMDVKSKAYTLTTKHVVRHMISLICNSSIRRKTRYNI